MGGLSSLWDEADIVERRKILTSMLDAVYVNKVDEKRIVAIRPKSVFRPLFDVAVTRRDSGILLISENAKEGQNGHLPLAYQAEADVRSVLLVETGEGRTPRPEDTPNEMYYRLIRPFFS